MKTIKINNQKVNVYQNENGTYCAAGVNQEGLGWETDDFDTIEELKESLETKVMVEKDWAEGLDEV